MSIAAVQSSGIGDALVGTQRLRCTHGRNGRYRSAPHQPPIGNSMHTSSPAAAVCVRKGDDEAVNADGPVVPVGSLFKVRQQRHGAAEGWHVLHVGIAAHRACAAADYQGGAARSRVACSTPLQHKNACVWRVHTVPCSQPAVRTHTFLALTRQAA